MFAAIVENAVIDLVGYSHEVVLYADVGNRLQFFARENPATGIVRGVEDDGLAARCYCCPEALGIQGVIRGEQGHVDRGGPGEVNRGCVVLVCGFDDDDLVSRVGHSHQRRHDSLGNPAGDGDVKVRIEPVEMRGVAALEVCGDGLPQLSQPPGDGVLIGTLEYGFCRRLADLAGRIEVRVSL